MNKGFFKLCAATVLWLASALAANADVMLNGDLTQEFNVTPGQTINGVLELSNSGRETAEVKIYQEDSAPDGGNRGHGRSNKSWIRLSSDRVVLPPNGRQKVAYTLQVPAGSSVGTFWSMVMLEPVSADSREAQAPQPSNDPDKFTVHIEQNVRYAVAILTHIGNGAANLVFANPKVEKNEKGQRVLGIDVQNTGNRHSRPVVTLEVFSANGQPVASLKGESMGLVPGGKKRFEVNLSSLKPGTYKSLLAAEDKNSGKSFGADVALTVQP